MSNQLRLVTDAPQPATAFDQFWAEYPRKVAKGAARARFNEALKVTTAEKLIAGAKAYAAWCRVNSVKAKHIAHGATWLNPEHERWDDVHETDEADEVAAVLEEMFK